MLVYTVQQAAKFCNLAPRTISKLFDAGKIKGYRIPGTRVRKIPHEYLIQYFRENGIEVPEELQTPILLLSRNEHLIQTLNHAFTYHKPAFHAQLTCCESLFSAGVACGRKKFRFLLVDFSSFEIKDLILVQEFLSKERQVICVALLPDDGKIHGLDRSIVSEVFKQPFEAADLVARLKTLKGNLV